MQTIWTADIVSDLRKMHAEGHSASEAARMLSKRYGLEITRNAVMGKLFRMGLSAPDNPRQGRKPPPPRSKIFQFGAPISTTPLKPVPFKEIERPAIAPPHEQKEFMELDDRFKVCRYPHGLKAYSYCARPTVPGTSYCEDHLRACYTVPPAKARVTPEITVLNRNLSHTEREDA
mgnify:FL=1